jgi:hypothetical protein
MFLKKVLFLLMLLIIKPGYSQQADYSWPLPEQWVREFIPFPLKFAPEIDYHGIEEIHFMPGWRGIDSLPQQKWSYTFIWYLDSAVNFDADKLEMDMTLYFDGLQRWVQKNSLGLFLVNITPEIKIKKSGKKDPGRFTGTAKILDVFFTNKPITLNMKICFSIKPDKRKTLVFFELSPKPLRHKVWRELDRHVLDFKLKPSFDL